MKYLIILILNLLVFQVQATEQSPPTEVSATESQLDESKIPIKVFTEDRSSATNGSGQKFLFTLFILLSVTAVGVYTFKKTTFKNQSAKSNIQIKMLSQHFLGPKKSLAVVRVAGESILIGITDHNISMMKTLSLLDEDLPQVLPNSFDEVLTGKKDLDSDEEEFSLQNIQSTVAQKLKSMRNIQ